MRQCVCCVNEMRVPKTDRCTNRPLDLDVACVGDVCCIGQSGVANCHDIGVLLKRQAVLEGRSQAVTVGVAGNVWGMVLDALVSQHVTTAVVCAMCGALLWTRCDSWLDFTAGVR